MLICRKVPAMGHHFSSFFQEIGQKYLPLNQTPPPRDNGARRLRRGRCAGLDGAARSAPVRCPLPAKRSGNLVKTTLKFSGCRTTRPATPKKLPLFEVVAVPANEGNLETGAGRRNMAGAGDVPAAT